MLEQILMKLPSFILRRFHGRHFLIRAPLISQSIADKSVHTMITSAKTPQLDLLPILNFLCIAIAPFDRYFRICICIDEDIEGAITGVELRKKGHGGGDLTEDGLDFELYFFFGFVFLWRAEDLAFCILRRRSTSVTG